MGYSLHDTGDILSTDIDSSEITRVIMSPPSSPVGEELVKSIKDTKEIQVVESKENVFSSPYLDNYDDDILKGEIEENLNMEFTSDVSRIVDSDNSEAYLTPSEADNDKKDSAHCLDNVQIDSVQNEISNKIQMTEVTNEICSTPPDHESATPLYESNQTSFNCDNPSIVSVNSAISASNISSNIEFRNNIYVDSNCNNNILETDRQLETSENIYNSNVEKNNLINEKISDSIKKEIVSYERDEEEILTSLDEENSNSISPSTVLSSNDTVKNERDLNIHDVNTSSHSSDNTCTLSEVEVVHKKYFSINDEIKIPRRNDDSQICDQAEAEEQCQGMYYDIEIFLY